MCDLINFSHMRAAAITSNAVAFIYSFFLHVFQSVVTFIFVTSVVQHLLISKILFHSNAISAGCSITVTFALEISFSLLNATAHSPHRL